MKAKRRTFWSFFTRIGAGFLAFWLAVMAMFTVLVSQQRAELMLSDMESKSNRLMGEDTDILLDPSTYDATDETELRRRLSKAVFIADSTDPPNLQIVETAITDLNTGDILQSNRWWLELIEGENLYRVDMSGQPREVCEAILAGVGVAEKNIESLPEMTFDVWADRVPGYRDDAYLKSITIKPTKNVGGTWEPTGEVRMVECTYDAVQMKNLPLKTMTCSGIMYPRPNGATAEQIAASLSSSARQALREWAENPSGANSSQTVEKPWLVRTYRRQIKYCPFAESHYVFVSYAAEGYPLKASLPVLIPVWAFSLLLALFCAASPVLCASSRLAQAGARGAGSPRNDCGACARVENAALRPFCDSGASGRPARAGKAVALSERHSGAGQTHGRQCTQNARAVAA